MNASPIPLVPTLLALLGAIGLAFVLIWLGEKLNARPLEGRLYSLITPNGTMGDAEQFFMALHGLLPTTGRARRAGRPHVSLELSGHDGTVRYLIWIPLGQEDFVRSLLTATHPGIELRREEADPLASLGACTPLAAWVGTREQEWLPIRTSHDLEPLLALLATLARARESETIHVSIAARPRSSGWQKAARRAAQALRHPRPSLISELLSGKIEQRAGTPFGVARAKAIEGKASRLGFDCNVRVVAAAGNEARAREFMKSVAASLRPFDAENGLKFHRTFAQKRLLDEARNRRFVRSRAFLLNTEELPSLWHLPDEAPSHVESVRSPKLPAPRDIGTTGRVLGESTFPEQNRAVGISVEDSRRHLHVLGPTGTGKTTLLANLALQDINAGRGICVLDPKGDLVTAILDRFPRHRTRDLVLVSPDDLESSIGINPLEYSYDYERDLIADNTLSIFKRIYERSWGMRTDDILKSSLLTLMKRPNPTLSEIPALLTDAGFRAKVLADLDDPIGLDWFWKWFNALSNAQRVEAIGPVLNKLRDFLVRPRIRRLLCQSKSNIDLRELIDSNGILLVNLSTGQWGEQTASLVGSFLVAKLWQAVRSRADVPEKDRRDFALVIDEFQEYMAGAGSFADALAQARSYHLSLTLANQHLAQLPKEVVSALSSNARSRITFQCGQDDSRYLAREFAPLDPAALMNLPRYEMAMRVSINGETSAPFTARAFPLPPVTDPEVSKFVSDISRRRFSRPAADIDAELRAHLSPAPPSAPTHGVGRRPLDQP
jgi:hypothetical protein